MVRLLLILIAAILVLAGIASQVVAAEDPDLIWLQKYGTLLANYKQGNESATKDLENFLAGIDVPVREIKKGLAQGLRKFAWKRPGAGADWWIIIEYKGSLGPVSSAFFCKGDPPADAKIMQ